MPLRNRGTANRKIMIPWKGWTSIGKESSMVISRAKTIAEYAIRRWLVEQNFAMECFTLTMDGNTGILKDRQGDSLTMVYDPATRMVCVAED